MSIDYRRWSKDLCTLLDNIEANQENEPELARLLGPDFERVRHGIASYRVINKGLRVVQKITGVILLGLLLLFFL